MTPVVEATYRSGQVAKLFKTSTYHVRKLLEAGLLEGELTEGQQWRVPASEVARFEKSGGLPPIPQTAPENAPARADAGRHANGLVGPPSQAVVSATEGVVITENLVKTRKLERELEETEDWFREREQQEVERQAEQEAAEQERLRQERAEREHERYLVRWERYALNSLPYDTPPEVRLAVHEAVRTRLANLNPAPAEDVTRRLVDAEVQKALKVWERAKQAERVIENAVYRYLPWDAKNIGQPSQWQIKATQNARQVIRQLDKDASLAEIDAAARRAVELVAKEYEARKAAGEDAEMRQRVIRWTSLPSGLTDQGRELATQAIAEAIATMPLGTPRHKLEQVRDEALAPFKQAVAREQQRCQDQTVRQAVRGSVSLPWDFPAGQKQEALAAVSKAISELPEGTPQRKLEEARDQAIQPLLDAHARQKRKAKLIEEGLREILGYVLKLEPDWDFEGKTARMLEQEITGPIRKRLEAELTGDEPADQVEKRVRQLVRKELNIAPRRAA